MTDPKTRELEALVESWAPKLDAKVAALDAAVDAAEPAPPTDAPPAVAAATPAAAEAPPAAPPEKPAEAPAASPPAPPAAPAPPAISDELRAVLERVDAFEAEEKERQKLARREWHHTVLNGAKK
jgi:hypothetical protein